MILATLVACAPGVPGSDPVPSSGSRSAESRGVIRAAEGLFAAMESRDTAALRQMFAQDARVVSIRLASGAEPVVQTRSAADFAASVGRSAELLRERMWAPRVETEGEFASLWAPYDFRLGERFSHCGEDAFHFVRVRGEWRIVALTYTIRTTGCETAPRP